MSTTLSTGTTTQFTFQAKDSFGNNLYGVGVPVWSSSNPAAGSINNVGLFTAVSSVSSPQVTTISATMQGITGTSTITVVPAQDGSIADVLYTVGASNIASFWDFSSPYVTLSGGKAASAADVRGGNIPLTFHGTTLPTYDGVGGEVSLDGATQYGDTPLDARYDLSSHKTDVLIGAVTSGSTGFCGITADVTNGGATPSMMMAEFSGVFHILGSNGNNVVSRVSTDTARHLFIASTNTPPGAITTAGPAVGFEVVNRLGDLTQSGGAFAAGNAQAVLGRDGTGYENMTARARLILNKDLTPADLAALKRYATARGCTLTTAAKGARFWGDSITAGFGASDEAHKWPSLVAGVSLVGYDWQNAGVGSRLASELASLAPTIAEQGNPGRPKNLCYALIGTNDLFNGVAAATVAGYIQTFASAAKAAGMTVILGTVFPRGNADISAGLAILNPAIRGFVGSGIADAVADLAADARLQNPLNTTYFNADTVHLTDTGYGVVASLFEAASVGLT